MRELIRDLAARGITVLLSSHLLVEVEELCNRVAIVRRGRVVYEGALAELRDARRGQLPAADRRRRAGAPGLRGPGRESRTCARRPGGGLLFRAAGEGAVGELSLALAESGAPVLELSPRQASLEDLFFQLTEGDDDGGGRRADGGGGRGAGLNAGRADRLPLGAAQAARPEAHLPRARRGGGGADHLRHRAGDPQRRTARRRLRPLRARHRPGDPAGAAALRLGLAVPADHRAGRRRHRRRRGPRPHPEDDPHPLGRAPAGVRGQGAGGGHLRGRRDRSSAASSRLVAGIIASGFNPIVTLSGTRVSASHGLGAGRRQPRRLPAADPRHRLHRAAASRPSSATAPRRSSAR